MVYQSIFLHGPTNNELKLMAFLILLYKKYDLHLYGFLLKIKYEFSIMYTLYDLKKFLYIFLIFKDFTCIKSYIEVGYKYKNIYQMLKKSAQA